MPDGSDDDFALAAEFPAATREQWRQLVAGVLKGAPFDKQLVAKTCTTLTKVLSENDAVRGADAATRGRLRLSYACSFDDSNCGEGHKALFQPDPLGRTNPAGAVTFEDITILSILRRYIDSLPVDHVLRSDRLLLPLAAAPVAANPYSSCHLPEIVEQFYTDLVPPA